MVVVGAMMMRVVVVVVVVVVMFEPSISTFFTRCNVEVTGENGEPG